MPGPRTFHQQQKGPHPRRSTPAKPSRNTAPAPWDSCPFFSSGGEHSREAVPRQSPFHVGVPGVAQPLRTCLFVGTGP
eukprot:3121446-Lingulodinium_polyedra.AAC.1